MVMNRLNHAVQLGTLFTFVIYYTPEDDRRTETCSVTVINKSIGILI
jgi:hypothetical protein